MRSLEARGGEGVPELIALLGHRNVQVRIAAAEALGRLRDDRALQPLMDALDRSLAWGSGWLQLVLSIMAAIGFFLLAIFVLVLSFILTAWVNLDVLGAAADFFESRRRAGLFVKAASEAIARISEAHPDPRVGTVLRDLRAVSHDYLQQSRVTREASRQTARRLETLIGDLQDLPVAAASSAPALGEDTLPLPAGPPESEVETLPCVRS